MEMISSLCSNCTHAPNCSFRTGYDATNRPVLQCEEHVTSKGETDSASYLPLDSDTSKSPAHFKGLCYDCDAAPQCFWKREENIVFNCEHYQ